MTTPSGRASTFEATLSWIAFVLAIRCVAYIGYYIPTDRNTYREVFADFGTTLPRVTEWLMWIPGYVFVIVALIMGATAAVIQFRVRSKLAAMAAHLLLIVICLLAWAAYREIIMVPLKALIESVTDGPK